MSLRRRIARRGQRQAARPPLEPLSATLFAFAKPMMDSMPVPRRLAHVRAAMALARLAWNLPLLERDAPPARAAEERAEFEAALAGMPEAARALVARMMRTRLARWADDERLVASVEVALEGGDLRILATEGRVDAEA